MVDESAEDRSSSAIFYHGVKSASVVRKYWMIQKDDTIFPKCEFTPDDFFSDNHKSWKTWLWNLEDGTWTPGPDLPQAPWVTFVFGGHLLSMSRTLGSLI